MPSAEAFTAPFQKADTLDFGLLDEPLQSEIILAVIADPEKRDRLLTLNPALARMGRPLSSDQTIRRNCSRILRTYGLQPAAERLEGVYRCVRRDVVRHRIDKTRLIMKFMNLNSFSLLKWNVQEDG